MSNRWKMNRIGFVNFWLYDEEIFELKDGKLLIRGSNGSGKSVTTQSIVSFILDGDRSPERLDPFGSTGRKMEYYFLQDGEKDEQTGYIFLELKKGSTEQYLTLGIGQKASKGKQMSFWGFILNDGRRIGVDFELYRDSGGVKTPFSEKDLLRRLGDKNKFATTQREYIEMVNKELFGFSQIGYYKKLINFLLKIRTSKLSTGIKPVDVYRILKDSLQVLEDDDLRILADTLEIMDNMQMNNEERQREMKSLLNLKSEYDRYNRFILWKKANTYNETKNEHEKLEKTLRESFKEIEKLKNQKANTTIEIENTLKRLDEIKDEIKIVEAMDLEKHVRNLAELEKKLKDNEKEFLENEGKFEDYKENLKKDSIKKYEEEKRLDDIKNRIIKHLKEMKEINETLLFNSNLENEDIIYDRESSKRIEEVKNNLEVYREQIDLGLEALKIYRELSNKSGEVESRVNNLKLEMESKEAELQKAILLEDGARNSLIEDFYTMKGQNEFLKLSKNDLEKIVELVKKYEGLIEAEEIKRVIEKNYNSKNQELQEEKLNKNHLLKIKTEEYDREIEELNRLKELEEEPPKRKEEVIKCREELQKAEINFISLYEAIDFSENLSKEERNTLESQLKDSGLLDSLIISYEDRERAYEIIEKYSDKFIKTVENLDKKITFKGLSIEEIDEKLRKPVEDFLKSINIREDDSSFEGIILEKNGYFRNGVLEGYSSDREEASFIGVNNRKRKLEQTILEKEERCADFLYYIKELEKEIKEIDSKLSILKNEYENTPKFSNLNAGIKLREESEEILKRAKERFEIEDEELSKIKLSMREWNQKVIERCRILPFSRIFEEYEEAKIAGEKYMLSIYDLESYIRNYNVSENRIVEIEDSEIKNEELRDYFSMAMRRIENEIEKNKNSIEKINEILNSPENLEATKKLKKLEDEKSQLEKSHMESEKIISNITGLLVEKEKNYNIENERFEEKRAIVEKTEKLYKEELELGYVQVKNGDSIEKIEKLEDILKLVKEREKDRAVESVSKKLQDKLIENKSSLEKYMIGIEEIFDEDPNYCRKRNFIRVIKNGKKISLYDFEKILQDEIIQGELAIEAKDRELIIDILTGNIGHKINDYIYESKMWIKDMTKIMLEMDTSMELKFSLDWKAKEKLSENELDIKELEVLLRKDVELLPSEDLEKISSHFKSKLKLIREELEENKKEENSYMAAIKKVLDYREWFEFKIYIHREGKPKKELTNDAYNKFSGGEKAMSIYIPLLAAASAQYKKAKEDCPRIIALDEAFAGIDDKNIDSMFELIEKLDFDYIMNSQQLWGCYESVKNLRIAELTNLRDKKMILVNRFLWNGKNKSLEL